MVINVIKGYLDDSQTPGQFWALGGYVGRPVRWNEFDEMWPMALANHDVPYFHMRELQNPNGIYRKWYPAKDHEAELNDFFAGLAKVIEQSRLEPFCCLVRVKDLERFNAEKNLNLEPYPLAAYGCMVLVGKHYAGQPVELVFDHCEKIVSKLAKAQEYADSDKYYGPDGVFDNIAKTAFDKNLTSRVVPALQAADFWTWEYRKNHTKLDEWRSLEDCPQQWSDEQWEHMDKWMIEKHGGWEAGTRKSAQALLRRPNPQCLIWHYQELCDAHEARGGVWA